jgi:hypothetical protein
MSVRILAADGQRTPLKAAIEWQQQTLAESKQKQIPSTYRIRSTNTTKDITTALLKLIKSEM